MDLGYTFALQCAVVQPLGAQCKGAMFVYLFIEV